jgi:sporulation protein YlmC with PRC-barrel domain
MNRFAIAAAPALTLAAALVAVPAIAQQATPSQQPQSQQQAQQQGERAPLSADAHHVIDKQAMNAQGKEVGKIKDVLIGQDGKVQALVVDVKGKKRAVPWNDVAMRADQLTVNMSDQQLSQLPEYRGEKD